MSDILLFSDVTLVCKEECLLYAHRLILKASNAFFYSFFNKQILPASNLFDRFIFLFCETKYTDFF
jgi:hypothetical protein